MTLASDRDHARALIDEARANGARLAPACRELGIVANTYRRWQRVDRDRRPEAERPTPPQALEEAEYEAIRYYCYRRDLAGLPPAQIVPWLLDEKGLYLASESTFYRVLRADNAQHHRGRAAAPTTPAPAPHHRAEAPNEIWSWDVTYLPTSTRGLFFYLYLIIDLFSRKIVGFEVFDAENVANSCQVLNQAIHREGIGQCPRVLHADNGAAMRGATLKARLEVLGIEASYSRPRVCDDNPYSEALFRTCKYRPLYPTDGFATLEAAREWVLAFVDWYNTVHRHSAIRYLTPEQRHQGRDVAILAKRDQRYQEAKAERPERWSGKTRNWTPVGAVELNPS
jgi:transposase InsO family protein